MSMADEENRSGSSPLPSAGIDPIAGSLALGGASRGKADAYLDRQANLSDEQIRLAREQIELSRLQVEDLRRENKLRHWSLRVRHISDVLKLSFELALALIFAAVVACIAGVIWTAAHDDGLVIEAFKVPPDMAARGLTGDVVASLLLDRLTDLQDQTDSARAPNSYSSDWGNDIKIDIPNTGVSIGEAYRYLAGWLGHQTHITGEIYRTANGIALTTRVTGSAGAALTGSDDKLNNLVESAAERIYRVTQPYRYAAYMTSHGDFAKADSALQDLALNGPESEKPWAYALWLYLPLNTDDIADALDRAHKAIELGPNLALAQINAAQIEADAGHDEQELADLEAVVNSLAGDGRRLVTEKAAIVTGLQAEATTDEELGDFRAAIEKYAEIQNASDFVGSHWSSRYMQSNAAALMHDVLASRHDLGTYTDAELFHLSSIGAGWNNVNYYFPQFAQAAELGRWAAARRDIEQALAAPEARGIDSRITVRAQAWPWLALAEANMGDASAAGNLIGKTRLDCYLCLRVRGGIDVEQRNWNGANYWFARAAALAPSIPFAYAEWGAMLLREGKYEEAIAKFREANIKGPHYADPLEMWGEALIAKNRSDLALAKFAEADKYAPNWGRLHLKWGEALLYSGKRDEAKKQFALAAGLDLSAADRAQLAGVSAAHV
jgi:tetratricopeptide (TPR) repeat protein